MSNLSLLFKRACILSLDQCMFTDFTFIWCADILEGVGGGWCSDRRGWRSGLRGRGCGCEAAHVLLQGAVVTEGVVAPCGEFVESAVEA
jgi:hypothetical protein